MIIAALQALLAANPAVLSLVGDRISPQPMPQGQALPSLTVLRVSSQPVSRAVAGQTGLFDARIQVDAWGKTLVDAQGAADAVQGVLDPTPTSGRRRRGGPLYIGLGSRIDHASMLNQQDFDESDVQDPDPSIRIHRISTDYRVRYARES